MISFRDTTYCSSDCTNTECQRNEEQHRKDRERFNHLDDIPSAWCDFSQGCPEYVKQSD